MRPVSAIQILSSILIGLNSMKWLADCSILSKMDGNQNDSLQYPVSSMKEEMPNLETTILSDYVGKMRGSHVTVAENFLEAGLGITETIFEDLSSNNSSENKSNWKRDTSYRNWTHTDKMRYLQLHNMLRGNVTPPAGDMAYLEWDTELEKLAQMWADNCVFGHGQPDEARNYSQINGEIGQNLYYGNDPTGYIGLYMWYEEYHNYDLRSQYCLPNTQCGHYVQMAWSESTKIGCAKSKCIHQRGHTRNLLVCNYSPGAMRGLQIYRVAEPCSQCLGKNVLCLKNLCVTQEQCKNNPFDCQDAECNLKCHNCGRLNKETCTCECTDGWDSADCSQLCQNMHPNCGRNPGYPNKRVCPFLNYEVANTYCRKMCETCQEMQETSNNICCRTKLCEEGYVLDPSGKSCECLLLCPGHICDCFSFKISKDMDVLYSQRNGKTVATFSCHNNLKLIGSNTSECQRDGKWSISSPYCENCPSFEIRKDINILYSESNNGTTVASFSCHNNKKLIGTMTSECQPNGNWTFLLPYCEDCPPFEIGKDVSIEYSESNKGETIATFSCRNNTSLIGSNTSECQPDGRWSVSLPYCEDEKEAIMTLAAVRSGAESLRTFQCITIWIVILKFINIYLHKIT